MLFNLQEIYYDKNVLTTMQSLEYTIEIVEESAVLSSFKKRIKLLNKKLCQKSRTVTLACLHKIYSSSYDVYKSWGHKRLHPAYWCNRENVEFICSNRTYSVW